MDSVEPKKKRSALSFLLWWKTDPVEVQKQVAQYMTLKPWQSARGISMLLCLFSVVVTALLGSRMELSQETIIAESIIWSTLGLFMYRGHRWAFLVGMVLWTLAKGTLLLGGVAIGAAPIVQIIWWAIYLSAFYLGFTVENARRAPRLAPV